MNAKLPTEQPTQAEEWMASKDACLFLSNEHDIEFDATTLRRVAIKLGKARKLPGAKCFEFEVNGIGAALPSLLNPQLPEGYSFGSTIRKRCPSIKEPAMLARAGKIRAKWVNYGTLKILVYHFADAWAIHCSKIVKYDFDVTFQKRYKRQVKPFYKKAIKHPSRRKHGKEKG